MTHGVKLRLAAFLVLSAVGIVYVAGSFRRVGPLRTGSAGVANPVTGAFEAGFPSVDGMVNAVVAAEHVVDLHPAPSRQLVARLADVVDLPKEELLQLSRRPAPKVRLPVPVGPIVETLNEHHRAGRIRAFLRAVESSYYQDLPLPAPVYDVGCGDGHFASLTFDQKIDVGLDPWHGPIHEAKKFGAYPKSISKPTGPLPVKPSAAPQHCAGHRLVRNAKRPNRPKCGSEATLEVLG